jgi:hypothetical protein
VRELLTELGGTLAAGSAAGILAPRCQHVSGRWNDFAAPSAPGLDPGLCAAV